MNRKRFYEKHFNFSGRTLLEYYISPGIKCKFDLLKSSIGSFSIKNGIDLGSSGNSFIHFLDSVNHKSFFDIANLPLKQYSQKQMKELNDTEITPYWHPLCGDLTDLPYRDGSFDFVSALDVLEHIEKDEIAISEISRILKTNGIAVITVPHRMKFYTNQDKLIGHFRRYEIQQINTLFKKYNLTNIRTFGVYGNLMKIADVQSLNPEKTEEKLIKLRYRYNTNIGFRTFWDIFVKIGSIFMKIDAKYHSLKKIMNVGLIYKKQ